MDKGKLFMGVTGLLMLILLVALAAAVYAGPTQTNIPKFGGAYGITGNTEDDPDPIIGTWFCGLNGNMYTFDATTCTITYENDKSTQTYTYRYIGIKPVINGVNVKHDGYIYEFGEAERPHYIAHIYGRYGYYGVFYNDQFLTKDQNRLYRIS